MTKKIPEDQKRYNRLIGQIKARATRNLKKKTSSVYGHNWELGSYCKGEIMEFIKEKR